jgi:hypothetical protein
MYRYAPAIAPELSPPPIEGLAWSWLDLDSIDRLFEEEPGRRQLYQRYLKLGHLGAIATVSGEWAACVWMALPGSPRPPQIPLNLAHRAFWLFSSATQPRFGGQGLYKFVMRMLIIEAFRREPLPEILGDIDPNNIPPRRGTKSLGFVPVGMLDCIYLWVPRLIHVPILWHWDRRASQPPLPEQ